MKKITRIMLQLFAVMLIFAPVVHIANIVY